MPDERRSTRLLSGQIHFRQEGPEDEAIAALAAVQHGVVARRQLLDLGIGHEAINHRLAVGRLHRRFPGGGAAYAVGHVNLSLAGLAAAGVITAGASAAASHWTAAALHGLLDRPRPLVHVTCTRQRRPRAGLFIHRAVLPQADLSLVDGIPVTSVARTCLDLSAEGDERGLRRLIKRAEFEGLLAAAEISEILARYPRRRGRRTLARIAAGYALTAGPTQSPLEDDFLEFCGERGIPLPATNVPIFAGGEWRVVDCVWRAARLAVELDGRDAHARELAFEDDRARDRALTAAGWRPIRITKAQLLARADELERDLRAALELDGRRFTRAEAR